jgi:putative SOS response-associated peptidase YedK
VLQFSPRDRQDMLVPCLWDKWEQGGHVLNSFALITDEPPAEVAAAGHDRCPVNLTREAAEAWLRPRERSVAELLESSSNGKALV